MVVAFQVTNEGREMPGLLPLTLTLSLTMAPSAGLPGAAPLLDRTLPAQALGAPGDGAAATGGRPIHWRILGTVSGAGLGAFAGGLTGQAMMPSSHPAFWSGAAAGTLLGGTLGYLAGDAADGGALAPRIGIGAATVLGVAILVLSYAWIANGSH